MKIKDVCDVESIYRIFRIPIKCEKNEDVWRKYAQAISDLEVKLTLDGDRIYEIISEELNKGLLDDLSTADILRKQAQALKSKAEELIVREK